MHIKKLQKEILSLFFLLTFLQPELLVYGTVFGENTVVGAESYQIQEPSIRITILQDFK